MRRASIGWILGLCLAGCANGSENVVIEPDSGVVPTDLGKSDTGAEDIVDVTDAGDVVDATDAGPPCRTNDECTAPDLCTNAQVCRFGHCVVIGGPASCDDSVACTDDRCDATAGRCVHTANDMRCPSGRFCVPSSAAAVEGGCLAELPCELGDTTCARLQGDPCTGTWSCDPARLRCVRSAPYNCDDMDRCTMDVCMMMGTSPTCMRTGPDYQTDAMNCGACGRACMAGPHQVAACAMGMCQATCEAGWSDLDRMPANGCECNAMDADAPDLMFRDTNCDGIDGNASAAIFVSPNGNDMNPGTMMQPKRTLPAAITAALAARPVRAVYAAQGTYTGALTITSGVSIYGGYDDMNGWSRDRANTTSIESDTNVAVTVTGVTAAMELQLLSITASAGTDPGESSYGMRVLNSSGRVTVRGCTVAAGSGANGDPGMAGAQGAQGGNGGGASGQNAGPAGSSPCGVSGGNGGRGGGSEGNGQAGGNGSAVTGGGTAGRGGDPGNGTGCNSSSCGSGANAGSVGAGGGGGPGAVGTPGMSIGALSGSGVYAPPAAGAGTNGFSGGGGGGGGGSGGTAVRTRCGTSFSCRGMVGGGGGGGGAGGCGGGGGRAGQSGGGSFAVISIASNLELDGSQLRAGRGGRGGNGGAGGTGGMGGAGGGGASGECCNGPGAPGLGGGNGGNGAGGAGGAGGPSFCVWFQGTPPTINAGTTRCVRGGAGSGGTGGSTPGGTTAGGGPVGVTEDYHAGN